MVCSVSGLVGCDTVQFCRWTLKYQSNRLLPASGLKLVCSGTDLVTQAGCTDSGQETQEGGKENSLIQGDGKHGYENDPFIEHITSLSQI
jgi:hypothetical protein